MKTIKTLLTSILFIIVSINYAAGYEYIGVFYGPEKPSVLFFDIHQDSISKKCFLTSTEFSLKKIEARYFEFNDIEFIFSYNTDSIDIDLQVKKSNLSFDGGAKINGLAARVQLYKIDKTTEADLKKYCGTYYSIGKKDSICITQNESNSLKAVNKIANSDDFASNILYPIKSDIFISNGGNKFEFKLRNFEPWQIMFVFNGFEYFYYKDF